jgi:hypothetical protein
MGCAIWEGSLRFARRAEKGLVGRGSVRTGDVASSRPGIEDDNDNEYDNDQLAKVGSVRRYARTPLRSYDPTVLRYPRYFLPSNQEEQTKPPIVHRTSDRQETQIGRVSVKVVPVFSRSPVLVRYQSLMLK